MKITEFIKVMLLMTTIGVLSYLLITLVIDLIMFPPAGEELYLDD